MILMLLHRHHCEGFFNIKGEYEIYCYKWEVQKETVIILSFDCRFLSSAYEGIIQYDSKIPIPELLKKNKEFEKDMKICQMQRYSPS